jgi:hypothetical protein
VADGWCWFVLRGKYCWLVAGGWFVVREKYCWLVADKPSELPAVENPAHIYNRSTNFFSLVRIVARFLVGKIDKCVPQLLLMAHFRPSTFVWSNFS